MYTSDAQTQFRWPEAASTARRILIKPNAGYPLGHPVTTRVTLLLQVIESLKVINPSRRNFNFGRFYESGESSQQFPGFGL